MLLAVIAARLLVPLFIPRFPLPGIIAALLLDAVDRSIFEAVGVSDLSGYQTYDKALDIYYLTIAYASTIRNWDGGAAFEIGRALWYYRLFGVMLFEYTEARWMLLAFANTFEYYFIAIEAIKARRNPFILDTTRYLSLAALIWTCIKLPQEWWLHIAQLDVTDFLKEHVFHVPLDSAWLPALANRPLVTLVLLASAALLVVALRTASRHLPPGDWPLTFASDAQGAYLGWPAPPRRMIPTAFFGWTFVEKAVLVTLVTLIFEEILPGTSRTVPQVAVATSAIIALSTLLSHQLARRGLTWGSAIVEFIVMGGANTAIAVATARLLRGSRPTLPLETFLFLVALLTLIVVLFDRFTVIDRRRTPKLAFPHKDSVTA